MASKTRILGALFLLAGVSLAFPLPPARAGLIAVSPHDSTLRVTPQGKITQLAIDPGQPATIYAGTDANGIYRSDNGGATWTTVSQGLPPGVAIGTLLVNPTNTRTVYAATEKGVYKTDDRGAIWSSQGPPSDSATSSLALDPAAAGTLYAGTMGDGMYRSTNYGGTWSDVGPRLTNVQVVATQSLSGTVLFAGTNDGLLYSARAGIWHRAGLGHVSVVALGISASAPRTIYAGTGDGMLLSHDGGISWARAGLRGITVTTISVDRTDPRIVYAASSDGRGLFRTDSAGRSWRPLVAGLSSRAVYSLAFDPSDSRVAYAGVDGGVFKSLQAGASWASPSIYDRTVFTILQPALKSGTFLAGTNGGVYTSSDGGVIWNSAGLGNHGVPGLLRAANALLAASEAGVYRTEDGGHSWSATLQVRSYALLPDPAVAGGIYAGTNQGIYHSSDGGKTWTALAAGSGAIDTLLGQADGTIYAGGPAGVLVSHDSGASFKRYSVNEASVAQLLAQPGIPRVLYARTNGGRIYRSDNGGVRWTDASVGTAGVSALTFGADQQLYASTSSGIYRSSSRGFSWILTNGQTQGLNPLVLQPALGGGAGALLEGLAKQGVIVQTLSTTPASPFAPLAQGTVGQYFPDSGHFVRAPFLDWYKGHNGAAIFGSPRTEALHENGRLVQYFQNALLVYHPEFANTSQVIGLEAWGQTTLGAPAARIQPFDNTTKRRYFSQTGHSLGGEFLSFWRTYGGVDVFGYPISEPMTTSQGIVVQYFQNARLEANSSAGAQYFNTRLSSLGDDALRAKGWIQ